MLTRNPNAVQIGLTATPRQLDYPQDRARRRPTRQISADNLRHFGEPVYEYDIGQGIEDGYLAACEIVRRDIFLEGSPFAERETGLAQDDLWGATIADARTGEVLSAAEARERYEATSLRGAGSCSRSGSSAMVDDLFDRTSSPPAAPSRRRSSSARATTTPTRSRSRSTTATPPGARRNGRKIARAVRLQVHGRQPRAASTSPTCAARRGSHFIATTVDLLTTGVDVPVVRNIVFFKYVRSPIAFYQMIGRGTRLDPATGKLMFRVYDYTDGDPAVRRGLPDAGDRRGARADDGAAGRRAAEKVLQVQGIDVRVEAAGIAIVTTVDGMAKPVTLEEYKERLAASLVERASDARCLPPTVDGRRRTGAD